MSQQTYLCWPQQFKIQPKHPVNPTTTETTCLWSELKKITCCNTKLLISVLSLVWGSQQINHLIVEIIISLNAGVRTLWFLLLLLPLLLLSSHHCHRHLMRFLRMAAIKNGRKYTENKKPVPFRIFDTCSIFMEIPLQHLSFRPSFGAVNWLKTARLRIQTPE